MLMLSKIYNASSKFLGCLPLLWAVSSFAHAVSSPAAYTLVKRFDVSGQLLGIIQPEVGEGFHAERYTYDSGLLVHVEQGLLNTWQSDAIAPNNWSGFEVHKTQSFEYNDLRERVLSSVESSDGTITALTQYSYDSYGRLKCKAVRMNAEAYSSLPDDACELGPKGAYGDDRVTRYVFDDFDNLLEEHRAVGTPHEQIYAKNVYDDNGNRVSTQDANNNLTKFDYDGHDRLQDRFFPSKTSELTHNPNDYEHYEYDLNGNVTLVRKRDGSVITYDFDNLNRQIVKHVPAPSQDIYYDYDLLGRELHARFGSGSGEGIVRTYDGVGNKLSETNTMDGRNRTLKSVYDKNNNRTRLTHADSKYLTYWFDGLNRLYRIQFNGSTHIWNEFDSNGKRGFIKRNYNRGGAITDFDYEPSQRLSSIYQNFTDNDSDNRYSFSYNPANQITALTISNDLFHYMGNDNHTGDYTPNGLNQYTQIDGKQVSHDANGNLTSYSGMTYNYDSENRLVSTSGDVTSSFIYDPLGRLFKVTINGQSTEFLYDGDALIAEYSGTTMTRRYIHGDQVDEPLVEYHGSGTSGRRFLHSDHRGSIVAISNESGTQIGTLTYDAFGIPGGENVGRFAYTGQIWFPELGLYHYKARMYNPYIGRFMQTDPIFYEDQMNMYAYVGNDPVNMVDPTGMWTGTSWNLSQNAQERIQANNKGLKILAKTSDTKLMLGLGAGASFKKPGIETGFGAEIMTGYQFSREGKSNGMVSDAQFGMNIKTSGYEFDAHLFKGGTSITENGAEYSESGPSCCGGALSVGNAKLDGSGNASMSLTLGLGKIEITVDVDAFMEAYGDEQLKSNTGNL